MNQIGQIMCVCVFDCLECSILNVHNNYNHCTWVLERFLGDQSNTYFSRGLFVEILLLNNCSVGKLTKQLY